jgi:hypothetical protein
VKTALLAAAFVLLVGHDAGTAPRPRHDVAPGETYWAPAPPLDGPILLGSDVIGASAFWSGLAL